MAELTYVGKSGEWVDGVAKVTGRAKFVGDYYLPDMLYAKVLRSPIPHANITRIDTSPALRVPGVVAAITADDFVDHANFGWPVKDAYVLAYRKVRYVGEPIAAVAAETEEAALAGIKALELELEPLPVISDPEEALKPGAPLIPLIPPIGQGNLCDTLIVRNRNPAPILKKCPVLLDETYHCDHQEHAYLETEAALAIPGDDGSVTVYSNNQSIFVSKNNLVMLLGLPQEKVRVIQAFVGGSFGGKDEAVYQSSAQVAKLALITGHSVRLILSREESIIASHKRQAMSIRVRIGADRDGTLQAAKVEALADSGAYVSNTTLAAWRATMHMAGCYRYQAVQVDTRVVYTNNAFCSAFRGFGNVDATAAIEQAIDELAIKLGKDPIDFRLQNVLHRGDRAMTGNVIDHEIGLTDCLEWVRKKSDWNQKREIYERQDAGLEKRSGIGVACYMHGCSLGSEGDDFANSTLQIEEDYSITLASGLTDIGQGSRTVFTIIAAETLQVEPKRIHMLRPDTDTAIDSGPTVASRSTMLGGNATRVAAQKLNRLMTNAAADMLGCSPAKIYRAGEQYIGPNKEPRSFEEVVDHAREKGLVLSTHGHWQMPLAEWNFEKGTGVPYHCYVFGAGVAEVEVDKRTGEIELLGIWLAHDGGKIIFPKGALGQMYGGIAQGIGYALIENFTFDHGYPRAVNYDGYLIPTVADIPPLVGTFIETEYEDGPYGAKNLAEPVMIATPPAIANAVFQAIGSRRRDLPITLERALLGHALLPGGAAKRCKIALGFRE